MDRPSKAKKQNPRDLLKLEIAEELGLRAKVDALGWASLSAQEAGKIGGTMAQRLKGKNSRER